MSFGLAGRELDVAAKVILLLQEAAGFDSDGGVHCQKTFGTRLSEKPVQQLRQRFHLSLALNDWCDKEGAHLSASSKSFNCRSLTSALGSGANWFWRKSSPTVKSRSL